ncbi:MAG: Gfo/Idh/MocA family oxidoreductase [Verrucomicrobiota bacterium]|jgi:predicted dehydrogenase|nr:Gfo/Idh/MocA family oxidoreductase [Verrucomicrobiota bacterium]
MKKNECPAKGGASRRSFLKNSLAAAGGAVALPYLVPASALGLDGTTAPSNRMVMGVIGTGGRGTHDLSWLLGEGDVQFVAVCDVQRAKRERAKKLVDEKYGNADCAAFRDFRELLAKKPDIESVIIATGDRWHTPASILCMRAGKDVYCEKPGALTIAEGQALVAAEQATKRIFQTGAQRTSETNFVFMGEAIRLGRLGKVHTARAHLGYLPQWPRVNAALPEEPLPPQEDLDWDLWVGPSPMRPYHHDYLKPWPVPGWYTQYDFAGGIAQWGSHTILQCQHDLGLAATSATEYEYSADLKKNGMTIRFANGLTLVAQEQGWHGSCGVRYEGDLGWIACADGYERPEASSPELLRDFTQVIRDHADRTLTPRNHLRNFLQCVRTREAPRTPATTAHRTMTTNLIMDICLDLKRNLRWDPVAEAFINDDEANLLRSRKTRAPYIVL